MRADRTRRWEEPSRPGICSIGDVLPFIGPVVNGIFGGGGSSSGGGTAAPAPAVSPLSAPRGAKNQNTWLGRRESRALELSLECIVDQGRPTRPHLTH